MRLNEYVIKIKGNVVGGGELLFNYYLVMSLGYEEEFVIGIEIMELVFGFLVLWIDEVIKDWVEFVGYMVVDLLFVVVIYLMELIKKYVYEFFGR